MLDYKKAFGTVCHKILLQKLKHYGIRGITHDLIASHLSDRKQFVSHQEHKSKLEAISHGVSQGLNLKPLMFLIYINDLPNSINCDAKLFADDTCLFLYASKPLILEEKTNDALESIHEWTTSQ